MTVCYLGIGSNLGDRGENIRNALQAINQLPGTRVLKAARVIETEPVGGPRHQGKFLNTAAKIKTKLKPFQLLRQLKIIERKLGRVKSVRWGARALDLDILYYGNNIIATKKLQVPHPLIFEREFVIRPLLELL